MKMTEIEMNIMAAPQGYYLATAISRDKKFQVGLPALFEKNYKISKKMDRLESQLGEEIQVGDACLIDNVYLLVVKYSSYDEPIREALIDAISAMHDNMDALMVDKLAIPKLCCGKNGLEWDDVKSILESEFQNRDVDILVCVQ